MLCENYKPAAAIPFCWEAMFVFLPPSYTEDTVTLRFKDGKGRVVYVKDLAVTNGFVELTTEDFPAGFFSPYAGTYTLVFYNGVRPEFFWSGKDYFFGYSFSVEDTEGETIANINPFNIVTNGY